MLPLLDGFWGQTLKAYEEQAPDKRDFVQKEAVMRQLVLLASDLLTDK